MKWWRPSLMSVEMLCYCDETEGSGICGLIMVVHGQSSHDLPACEHSWLDHKLSWLDYNRSWSDHNLPQTTMIRPQTIMIGPQTIMIGPKIIMVRPQTIMFRPQTTMIRPQTTMIRPQTIMIGPQIIIVRPQTIMFRPQTIMISISWLQLMMDTWITNNSEVNLFILWHNLRGEPSDFVGGGGVRGVEKNPFYYAWVWFIIVIKSNLVYTFYLIVPMTKKIVPLSHEQPDPPTPIRLQAGM